MRYDGATKLYPQLVSFIQQHFSIISVCPEVEIGLGVPRPPVQLIGTLDAITLQGRDAPLVDITQPMQNYCQRRPSQLDSIQGYIFKSKSPSCGIRNIPLFNDNGEIQTLTRGVFANAILKHFPSLPITDELMLIDEAQWDIFLHRVKQYQIKETE